MDIDPARLVYPAVPRSRLPPSAGRRRRALRIKDARYNILFVILFKMLSKLYIINLVTERHWQIGFLVCPHHGHDDQPAAALDGHREWCYNICAAFGELRWKQTGRH